MPNEDDAFLLNTHSKSSPGTKMESLNLWTCERLPNL